MSWSGPIKTRHLPDDTTTKSAEIDIIFGRVCFRRLLVGGWHLQKLFHFAAASISSDQGLIGKIVNALPDTATPGGASEGGIDE